MVIGGTRRTEMSPAVESPMGGQLGPKTRGDEKDVKDSDSLVTTITATVKFTRPNL